MAEQIKPKLQHIFSVKSKCVAKFMSQQLLNCWID